MAVLVSPGPGTGTGRAGVNQAGVEVGVLVEFGAFVAVATGETDMSGTSVFEGDFVLSGEADISLFTIQTFFGLFNVQATADALLDGSSISPGAFALEGASDVNFVEAGGIVFGLFFPSGVADSSFQGAFIEDGVFDLESEALSGFVGFAISVADFAMEAEALQFTVGQFTSQGAFALAGTAGVTFSTSLFSFFRLSGQADAGFLGGRLDSGSFAIEATADTRIVWSPDIGPGSGSVLPENEVSRVGCQTDPSGVSCIIDPATGACIAHPAEVNVLTGAAGVTIRNTEG